MKRLIKIDVILMPVNDKSDTQTFDLETTYRMQILRPGENLTISSVYRYAVVANTKAFVFA
ncbi:MAG: hypothetical protein JW709_01865 [Sedimentisphaerales bacterium]|nr:hypothetical protein [Sedimentisphaerales bacterium]